MMALANLWEYISKKPLIPNTTKVLKAKKTKISKNKFNPKNDDTENPKSPFNRRLFLIMTTKTKVITSAKSNHFISVLKILTSILN